jgi:large subunit ribosomal protein L1
MKLTKKRKAIAGKVDANKLYTLPDAAKLVKETTTCKFDASVDLHIQLGIDPKKADQAVRGTAALPHGTGKTKRVLVLTSADKEEDAKKAGADFVGLEEFVQKIEQGWTPEVGKAVEEVKKGKIAFKVDKFGIVHTSVGRVSFSAQQINENAETLLQVLAKMKPASAKGVYFKGISMASTMSPGIAVDSKSVSGLS